MTPLEKLKKKLEKIEAELSKCRGTVREDGWQTKRYANKMRKWDFYAGEKNRLKVMIDELENNSNLKS